MHSFLQQFSCVQDEEDKEFIRFPSFLLELLLIILDN